MKKFLSAFFIGFLLLFPFSTLAANLPISLFPLTNYSQNIDNWLSPQDPTYKKPLVSFYYQKKRLDEFYNHTFSTERRAYSPWSQHFVSNLLDKNPGILDVQQNYLVAFSNKNKTPQMMGYGENFHPYPETWSENIVNNIDLLSLKSSIKYQLKNRAIIVKNTDARILPTHDPHFYSFQLPGQGYPFDNLQASALWVGTPVYVVNQTKDKRWSLVITPSFIAWIDSDALASTDKNFIKYWQKLVKKQLAAITITKTPVLSLSKHFQFTAYIGAVFPLLAENPHDFKIGIPVRDNNGKAYLHKAIVNKNNATKMPLLATPENFSKLIKTLQNRPYGWGNTLFYNDCSAELQSLYTPFGIWLPRNSSKQSMAGKMTDLTVESAGKRLDYLMKNGHPLMSIVYIGGHIFMYVGNYPNPNDKDHASMAMTYQNVWGLSPIDSAERAVIGQAVLLPLLLSYPENFKLNTLANKKFFQITDLDQWPDKDEAQDFTSLYF